MAFATASLRLWSGLCLDPMSELSRRSRPSSLYTFSSIGAWLGVVTSRDREFADFERIPRAVSDSHGSTDCQVCCVCLFHHHPK